MIFEFTWPDGNAFLSLRNAVFGSESFQFCAQYFLQNREYTVSWPALFTISLLSTVTLNHDFDFYYASDFWENWMQFSIVSQIMWPLFCSCASCTALHFTLMSLPSDSGCCSSAGSLYICWLSDTLLLRVMTLCLSLASLPFQPFPPLCVSHQLSFSSHELRVPV